MDDKYYINDDGMLIGFEDYEELIAYIKEIYHYEDVCMSEILASLEIRGLSVEATAQLYMEMRNWCGDEVAMIDENGDFVL